MGSICHPGEKEKGKRVSRFPLARQKGGGGEVSVVVKILANSDAGGEEKKGKKVIVPECGGGGGERSRLALSWEDVRPGGPVTDGKEREKRKKIKGRSH